MTTWKNAVETCSINHMKLKWALGIVPMRSLDKVLKVIVRVYTQIAALIHCGRPDWSVLEWDELGSSCTATMPPQVGITHAGITDIMLVIAK